MTYDIFGLTPQCTQVADMLAEKMNCRVVVPDFFLAKPWPKERYPPKEGDDLMGWIRTAGSWEDRIRDMLNTVIARLKGQGTSEVSLIGFCWGARMCLNALNEKIVSSVALVHPSFVNDNDFTNGVDALNGPVAILRSKDDPEMLNTKAMFTAAASPKFVFEDFNTMPHGFMGARADFNDQAFVSEIDRAMTILVKFFGKCE
jgi:dienelactone hydrolase